MALMADPNNRDAVTTSEGSLPLRSSGFETESWAFFYLLGEFLRELQTALKKEEAARTHETPESL